MTQLCKLKAEVTPQGHGIRRRGILSALRPTVSFILSVIFSSYLDGIEGPKASDKVTNIRNL